MTMNNTVESLLEIDLAEFWQRVHAKLISDTAKAFRNWNLTRRIPDGTDPNDWQHQQLSRFVVHKIGEAHNQVVELHKRYGMFASQVQRGATEQEIWQHQASFLKYLGYTKRQIRRDEAARRRWFDNDAIKDRYQNQAALKEQLLCFLLQRLGQLIDFYGQSYSAKETQILLKALDLQSQLLPLLRYRGDKRVATQAMACLTVAFEYLGNDILDTLDPTIAQQAFRIASDPYESVWLQTEALAVLFTLGQDSVSDLLTHRLGQASTAVDDFFFRARAVQIVFQSGGRIGTVDPQQIAELVLEDPSIFVRQQLADRVDQLSEPFRGQLFARLISVDTPHQIRGRAWLNLQSSLYESTEQELYVQCYYDSLDGEVEPLMLRLLMELAPSIYESITVGKPEYYARATNLLSAINTDHEETRVRRWAAQAREKLWYKSQQGLALEDQQALANLSLSESVKLQRPDLNETTLGRHLAVLSQKGYGFDVQDSRRQLKIRGGYKLGFRLWRFIHEWRNPATDKRQNHNHMTGRIYYGNLQAPPLLLAESSATKVPGEPLLMDGEEGWRPYLPLVDQILSSLDQGWPTQPLKLYTSEGVTEVMPPRSFHRRLWAKFWIIRKFESLARLRNWQEHSDKPAHAYLDALVELGFSFRIRGYEEKLQPLPVDSRVSRFFPAFIPFYSMGDFWQELQNYFYSVYQNTIAQLSIFLVGIGALFFGQHFWLNMRFKKARQSIPYVIGGWGTRGKSGTERLKAALLNASGVSLVSKSSGCEAQFLYAPVHRGLKELFLFRPYDKASIWEQMNITRLAAKLNVNVFLWECMGLTPRYIHILQQQWMKDDLSTITNCYPDHEDIQGPSGIDIPKVMMLFVPKNATLISSEDSMSPLMESAARKQNTEYYQVTWHDGFLLAPDILERFPYEEHPTNIALVLKVAHVLGFPADLALKAMADYVVPDLGVLKIYPESHLQGRRFMFINGMSANERFAALGNWQRLHLDKITPQENPDIWLTTVVNNRADRIARSQVFAKMLVNDLSADMHFLIGTNLDGLRNYIEHAWQARVDELPLNAKSADERRGLKNNFVQLCQYIRLLTTPQQAQLRIQAMLEGLRLIEGENVGTYADSPDTLEASLGDLNEEDREAIIAFSHRAQQEQADYERWCELIENPSEAIDEDALRAQLWQWYQARFVAIEDIHASGNTVINTMVRNTPPGLCNKMIGLQNIKGTGLDFIYRWQTWDKTWKLCQLLNGRAAQPAENAARELASVSDFGLLDENLVLESCSAVRAKKIAQTEVFQAELNVIEANVKRQVGQIRQGVSAGSGQSTLADTLIGYLEAFLDPGNAVKRRKTSERIYADLGEQRISIERAVHELQGLNKEQKGGWLRQKLKNR